MASLLARRFIQRWDIQARQLDDGRYLCIREPLEVEHLVAHLSGDITLGTYVLNQASQTRFVALDVDDERRWRQLVAVSRELAAEEVPGYLERSRRGGHLWFFFAQARLRKITQCVAQNTPRSLSPSSSRGTSLSCLSTLARTSGPTAAFASTTPAPTTAARALLLSLEGKAKTTAPRTPAPYGRVQCENIWRDYGGIIASMLRPIGGNH